MSFNFFHIRTDDFSTYGGGRHDVVITRDNYEAYFVMYVDDELNATEREAVEGFLQQNPDLEEEMVMLQQSVLRADEHIVFDHKELLFKNTNTGLPINELNCEEYFVQYGDDELTNEEKDKVEQFVYHHPQYQAEFELIQQVKLVPDNTLTFPDKTYLYRTEADENRVIAFPWWRFTAAAVTLLVIGSMAWYLSGQSGHTEVAGGVKETKPGLKIIMPLPGEAKNNNPIPDLVVVDADPETNTNPGHQLAKKSNRKIISYASNIQQPSHVKQTDRQPDENDAADPIDKSFSPKPVDVAAVGNLYERPVVKNTVIKNTVPAPLVVKTVAVKTVRSQPEDETDQSQDQYVLNTSINKTPLRGFFRRVSRVVDKVTNPDDNGKGGVRIANLAIALK
ncbi:MAG TPA: hypothetical protein VIM79_01970 [Niastella sp.]